MLTVYVESIGGVVVIECEGNIARDQGAFQLRDIVTAQRDARIIVLDLSEVPAIEVEGLSMLVFLQHWTQDHDIRLKLFNPRQYVWDSLRRVSTMREFDIASLDEMTALLAREERRYGRAA